MPPVKHSRLLWEGQYDLRSSTPPRQHRARRGPRSCGDGAMERWASFRDYYPREPGKVRIGKWRCQGNRHRDPPFAPSAKPKIALSAKDGAQGVEVILLQNRRAKCGVRPKGTAALCGLCKLVCFAKIPDRVRIIHARMEPRLAQRVPGIVDDKHRTIRAEV